MAIKVKINSKGIEALLKSPGVKKDLERRAQAIADRAGPGHVVESEIGPRRARAAVVTASFEARRREAMNRNLTRAIDAGR